MSKFKLPSRPSRRRTLGLVSGALLLLAFQNCGKFDAQTGTLSSTASSDGSVVPTPTSGSSPSTTPAAPLSNGDFVVISPLSNSRVSGKIAISGTAGPDVANVAAYTASGQKVASDVTPSNGTYSLSFDTEQLDNGPTTITVIGFTTAAGQSNGQKLSVFLPLDLENADKPAATPVMTGGPTGPVTAVAASAFLGSLGVNIHHAQGPSIASYVQPLTYLGIRNIRDDYADPADFISLHQQAGVMINMILKNDDLPGTLAAARALASAGALLSIEGANEANNFPITYQGQRGGGPGSWKAVAQYQTDLYTAMKADAQLKTYPLFSPSEAGGETDNVGLQFLTIPQGANTLFPAGTKFADFANIHNYVSSTQQDFYQDNQAWNAADPTLNAQWDALFVEFGVTWLKQYQGYSKDQLQTLPRVTTETGWDSRAPGGEARQGTVLLNTYLAQFKRNFKYTFIYMIRDGEGGGGNQGLFNADSSPKLAATYIHNLTTILFDTAALASLGTLSYSIANQPSTVHDLLLQKSGGTYELVIWDERATGQDNVSVKLGANFSSVKVYDPTKGTTAIASYQGINQLSLSLSDHPQVIELTK